MRAVLIAVVGLLAIACAGARDLVDREEGAVQGTQGVFWAGAERMPVHSEAAASAPVVGWLAPHEKVTRSRVEGGWAKVAAADRKLSGWVDNARLLWRLPESGAAKHAPAAAPAGSEPPPATPAPAAETTPDPSPTPAPAEAIVEPEPAVTPVADPPPAPDPPRRPRPATFDPF